MSDLLVTFHIKYPENRHKEKRKESEHIDYAHQIHFATRR